MSKALIMYHRVDYDGLFSLAAANEFFENNNYEIEKFGYNYRDDFSEIDWNEYDIICLLDITLPVKEMKMLHKNHFEKVIWIDHHETSINDSKENEYDNFDGCRQIGTAACVLTNQYFFPRYVVPYAVQLIGANDVWGHNTFDWDNEVAPLQTGLRSKYGMNPDNILDNYNVILTEFESILKEGKLILDYEMNQYKTWCKRFAFEVSVYNGNIKGICMLSPIFSSKIFDSMSGYDVVICANKNNDGSYNVSMYAGDTGVNFHCGEYMKLHYGGGGHKGAAGGTLTEEQFIKLISNNIL